MALPGKELANVSKVPSGPHSPGKIHTHITESAPELAEAHRYDLAVAFNTNCNAVMDFAHEERMSEPVGFARQVITTANHFEKHQALGSGDAVSAGLGIRPDDLRTSLLHRDLLDEQFVRADFHSRAWASRS